MNKCVITIKVDITPQLPSDWKEMSLQSIREWIGDIPECLDFKDEANELVAGKDGYLVHHVEKSQE